MQLEYKKNKSIFFSFKKLSTVFFENYTVSYISLKAKEKNNYFGSFKDNKFNPKLEAKITEKIWKEIPSNFIEAKLGNYSFTENSFSAIVTIDCRVSEEATKKLMPKIIASFKARSTILLNQLHGKHGRVFWENCYKEEAISDLKQLNEVLKRL
ncbi:MAG: hypothetical protein EHM58_15715 [Ignavibacteriae bacterium]|nr:MAG: hypothetical protein EHM58_15715 [Ignavibacteriota bacterium]